MTIRDLSSDNIFNHIPAWCPLPGDPMAQTPTAPQPEPAFIARKAAR